MASTEITDRVIMRAAEASHEANRQYCKSIGDNSQPPWSDAPEWQRSSAIEGVTKILTGVIKTPEESHESWMQHKKDDGWVHGDVKDSEKKTHPCMVPYGQLPDEQQKKDAIFFSTVMSFNVTGDPSQLGGLGQVTPPPIMKYFKYDHLKHAELREISQLCCGLANHMVANCPPGPELSAGLRKLMEAKDCFDRTKVP